MSKGCSEDMTVVRYDMVAYSHDCSCILKTHNAYRKVLLLFDKRISRTRYVPMLTASFSLSVSCAGSAFVRNDAKVFRFCSSK